ARSGAGGGGWTRRSGRGRRAGPGTWGGEVGGAGGAGALGRRGAVARAGGRRSSGGALGCRRLLGRRGTAEALAVGLAPDAVSLGVLDARGMALDPDPQGLAEVERLLVGQAELAGELVDTDLLRQLLVNPLLVRSARGCLSSHTPCRSR